MPFRILRAFDKKQNSDNPEAITGTETNAFNSNKRGLDVTQLQSMPLEKEIRPILSQILIEMKKMNIHLESMTGERISNKDV